MQMTNVTLRILHVTDLHMGQPNQERVYHTMWESFFNDLERCHKRSGPWDVIVFSGDLAFSGTREQFEQVDRFLSELHSAVESFSSTKPVLLAVPGNHDLSRPSSAVDPVAMVLASLGTLTDGETTTLWNDILENHDSPYRRAIMNMFSEYMSWWATKDRGSLRNWRDGLLPGEFAAEFEKDGVRFGLVGLNTTFIQARGGDFFERLAVDSRQLFSMVRDDRGWLQEMDACILITHQPPSWLSPHNRENVFLPDIAKSGRFAIHLHGHEHVAKNINLSRGGWPARRLGLGRALMALEPTADGHQRLMGYQAWHIAINRNEGTGIVRCWPRKAELSADNHWTYGPDQSWNIDEDEGTEAIPESTFRAPNYRKVQRANNTTVAALLKVNEITAMAAGQSAPDPDLEKRFFYNSWKSLSEVISRSTRWAREFANGLKHEIGLDDVYRLPEGDFYSFDNFYIGDDTSTKLRYDSQLVALLGSYNAALGDVRKAIAGYNRIVYPISDRAFMDFNMRGWGKSVDPAWNEAKQKASDEYDAACREIVKEVMTTYNIPGDATIGDIRANTAYETELRKQREQTTQRVDKIIAIIKEIDKRREYYDIALEV
jgi:hypothetical protein